jgi:hypothetical protein
LSWYLILISFFIVACPSRILSLFKAILSSIRTWTSRTSRYLNQINILYQYFKN